MGRRAQVILRLLSALLAGACTGPVPILGPALAQVDAASDLAVGETDAAPLPDTVSPDTAPLDGGEVGDTADTLDLLDVVDVPDVPDVARVPDAAGVADVADVPDVADLPDVADVPDGADVPDIADVKEVAEVADVVDAQDAPDVADVLDAQDTPDLADVDDIADTPDTPDAPDAKDAAVDVGPPPCQNTADCSDGNACTQDLCGSAGCLNPALSGAPCSDGNGCTEGDVCQGGSCAAGSAAKSCDDGNPCTVDTCKATAGTCSHSALAGCCASAGDCDDGNPCSADQCVGGKCSHGSAPAAPLASSDWNTAGDLQGWAAAAGSGGFTWQQSAISAQSGGGGVGLGKVGLGTFIVNTAPYVVSLTSAPVTVPSRGALWNFYARLDLVNPTATENFRSLDVEVVLPGGKVWLVEKITKPYSSWEFHGIDLRALAGLKIQLRLTGRIGGSSTNATQGTGIHVDASAISPTCEQQACSQVTGCNSPAPCVSGLCRAGHCQWQMLCCTGSAQCDDGDACTNDFCNKDGECGHSLASGCCDTASQCDNGSACTFETCGPDRKCKQVAVAGQPSQYGGCCAKDSDCYDGESACTTDKCVYPGICTHEPTGAANCCKTETWQEGFDGTLSGWTLDNSCSATQGWQVWKSPSVAAFSAPGVLYYGKTSAKNFALCGVSSGTAMSPLLHVPNGSPKLKMRLYYDTEPGLGYDELEIWVLSVSQNKKLWTKASLSGMQGWTEVSLDLTPCKGKELRVQLRFNTGDALFNDGLGVLVDDIRLTQTCTP